MVPLLLYSGYSRRKLVAYNDVIPTCIINELLRGHQPTLPLYTPEYEIDEKFLESVQVSWKITRTETDSTYGTTGFVDHPAFADLRRHLAARKYIDMQTNCWNGDTVLRKFYLNQRLFEVGEQFPSAGAMKYSVQRQRI
jgi:hypothetical protein